MTLVEPARARGGPAAEQGARRLRVAATADYYLPGFKGGGALRSVAHMAEQLDDALEMWIVTRDRDLGDTEPYPGVTDAWTPVGGTPVRYLAPAEQSPAGMARALADARPEILYLNSCFSPRFTLLPLLLRRLGRVPRVPVVLAPRGELSEGALSLKRPKKVAFLRMARATGLYRGVLWQASSELEAAEVRRWFGAGARVFVAPDLRARPAAAPPPAEKQPGELRVVFLSRIAAKKNLAGALDLLAGVRGRVRFTVHGPVEDEAYWASCLARAAALPADVRMVHEGPLRPEEVGAALARHHLFLFPTLGENFGHVVLEALLAGLPVLTSDRTPWGGLEGAGAGWALPLEQPERFVEVLQAYVRADGAEHARRSAAARALGEAAARDASVLEANRALFRQAAR